VILELADGEARLLDPDDFGSLKAIASGSVSLAAGGPIARADEQHVWVRIESLRELAGPAATPEWDERFEAMLEFARSRGWVDEKLAAVRAHIESHTP
jgi:hypothetical protein